MIANIRTKVKVLLRCQHEDNGAHAVHVQSRQFIGSQLLMQFGIIFQHPPDSRQPQVPVTLLRTAELPAGTLPTLPAKVFPSHLP